MGRWCYGRGHQKVLTSPEIVDDLEQRERCQRGHEEPLDHQILHRLMLGSPPCAPVRQFSGAAATPRFSAPAAALAG